MTFRGTIPDFQLANPLYVGARVSFFAVDNNGNATTTLATLYAAPGGAQTLPNPQTLDSEGKFIAPPYIEVPVIAVVVGGTVGSHTTGVIGLSPDTGSVNSQVGGIAANIVPRYADNSGNLLKASAVSITDDGTLNATNLLIAGDALSALFQLQNATVAAAAATSFASSVTFVRVAGYAAAGDGGAALYKKVGSEPSHAGKFQSADGAWWEIAEFILRPEMFGDAGSVRTNAQAVASAQGGRLVIDNNGILTSANYGASMTNSGELFNLSVRNSTLKGTDVYTPIYASEPNVQDGVQSVLDIPASATVLQVNGFAAYMRSAKAAVNPVGLFAAVMLTVAGAPGWGINTLLTDNATRTAHSRTGELMIGLEADYNNTGAFSSIIGNSQGGAGITQPLSGLAYIVNSLGSGLKWSVGLTTIDGAASVAAVIGVSTVGGTNQPSQPIQMLYQNGAGSRRIMSIQAGIAGGAVLRIVSDESNSQLQLGVAGSQGSLLLAGAISGGVTQLAQTIAGAPTVTWGTNSGTPAVTATNPLAIAAATGDIAITANGISNNLLRQGIARSVIGVTGNSTANVADIQGTANQALVINAAGSALAFGQLNLAAAAAVTGALPEINGGTNQSAYTLGDLLYASASNTLARLPGNTTITRKFLRLTGTGAVSAAPAWDTILAADVPASALTKTDDTNVTLTLGGSPSTALLNAASLTLGWAGTLAVSRGGLGIGSGNSGGIPYFSGSATIACSAALTANAIVKGGGAAAAPIATNYLIDASDGLSVTTANSFNPLWTIKNTTNDANSALWRFVKNRNGGPASADDLVFWLAARAYDTGSTERDGAYFRAELDSVQAASVSVRWVWWTTNSAGTIAERMRLSASGGLSLNTTTDPGAGNFYLNGNLGIGVNALSSAFAAIAAGTTAKAQINMASSTAPTSPNNGDVWYDGTNVKIRVGGTTKTFTLT